MTKWKINPVEYSPSSGETIATAWQKQIKIDQDLVNYINRIRTMDASPGSNISDVEAFQFKVNSTDKTLLIRNASNTDWIICGYLDKDYFGINPETIYAVKNNGGVNSMEVTMQEPSGGSNGNIAIDTTNKKLYQKINGVWTLLLSLSASDMLDYANLIKNNNGDIGKISIVNTTPSNGNNGDIAIDITNKRMYQKSNDTWNIIFSLTATDLTDYSELITTKNVSDTAEPNKIPRADSAGKLPNNIAGSPDKIADKKIIATNISEGTSLVYRTSADGGKGGFVPESVSPGSVIDDTNKSISTTYSSNKIEDLANALKQQIKRDLLENYIYAVGKFYISETDSRNPSEILGFGTWEKLSAGHTLVSAGNVQTDNYSHNFLAGETGGEFVHQLSVGELPSFTPQATLSTSTIKGKANALLQYIYHNCEGDISTLKENEPIFDFMPANGQGWQSCNLMIDKSHTHTISINRIGENLPHTNLPPYISAHIWKRVS